MRARTHTHTNDTHKERTKRTADEGRCRVLLVETEGVWEQGRERVRERERERELTRAQGNRGRRTAEEGRDMTRLESPICSHRERGWGGGTGVFQWEGGEEGSGKQRGFGEQTAEEGREEVPRETLT